MITHSSLHFKILDHIIQYGYAPEVKKLSTIFHSREQEVIEALYGLQEYHGVVLHPHKAKIWVIHPFSLAPTNFFVESKRGKWWGNCAWCSLGIAAILKEDCKITTTLGGETQKASVHIVNGQIQEPNYCIHFPIPMRNAWDNVIYSCSNMLLFEDEQAVENWSARHQIPKGDVQPIAKIWDFSKEWYGNHLDPNWEKWTKDEARQLFKKFGLSHEIWNLDGSGERF